MGYKLPVVIKEHFAVSKVKTAYHLTCNVCKGEFVVERPLTDNDVRPFIDHAAMHDTPTVPDHVSLPLPSIAPARPSALPTLRPINSSMPPPANSAYMIVFAVDEEPVISYIPLSPLLKLPTIGEQSNGNHVVILTATNRKHALVVASRLIDEHKRKVASRPSSSHP